jgi:NNP family nitrate/nitrite transporter-like MFS transporter
MRVARSTLLPLFGGWREVMVASAAAIALTALLWLALVRDGSTLVRHARVFDALALARDGRVARVAAMHFLVFGGYLALLSLLPRALLERGMSPAQMGGAIALWLVSAGIANYAGPWLSDALGGARRPFLVGGAVLAAAALGAVAFCAAYAPSKIPIFLAIAAIGGGSFAPLLLTLPLELPGVGPAKAGAALGLLMLVGQLGGFLLPVVSGAMAEAAGSPAALVGLAVAHLLVVVPAIGLSVSGAPSRSPSRLFARSARSSSR